MQTPFLFEENLGLRQADGFVFYSDCCLHLSVLNMRKIQILRIFIPSYFPT